MSGSLALGCLGYINGSTAAAGGRDLSDSYWIAAVLAVLGLGLLLHSRFAAMLFACGGAYCGLGLAFVSLREAAHTQPFPMPGLVGLLVNLLFALLLIWPCISFYRHRWRLRKW